MATDTIAMDEEMDYTTGEDDCKFFIIKIDHF